MAARRLSLMPSNNTISDRMLFEKSTQESAIEDILKKLYDEKDNDKSETEYGKQKIERY